jgi:CotH kinase protein/Lamin Tail Domain
MMKFYPFFFFFTVTTRLTHNYGVAADVVISEIADKGTSADVCSGNDWVELYNDGTEAVDVSGWILHDDKGPDDEEALTFSSGSSTSVIGAGEFLLLCTEQQGEDAVNSPQFGIGKSDTITLIDTSTGSIIASEVTLTGYGGDAAAAAEGTIVVTFSLDAADGTFKYTTTPTPGSVNVISTPPVLPSIQERLAAQNALGTRFFNMDDNGLPLADGSGLPAMVDFYIDMEEDAYQDLMQNATYQTYVPFTSARVVSNTSLGQEQVLWTLSNPGRIRTKGQYTLVMGTCIGSPTLPFMIDLNSKNDDDNNNDEEVSTQQSSSSTNMFGMERLYLRNHMDDWSYMREWTSHRMLARFGLPHLRSRTVRFFINNNKIGLYTLMEAVDQDYVYHRSFPTTNFNKNDYALYKVKTLSRNCGRWSESELSEAQARLNRGESVGDDATPYFFKDGDHREKIPVLSWDESSQCNQFFRSNMGREADDVRLAYLRYNQDCGTMLVEEGLIDRDLGNGDVYDTEMATFINDHLAGNTCDAYCQNSNLASKVNLDNWLKNFAVYAVALIQDSVSFLLFFFV